MGGDFRPTMRVVTISGMHPYIGHAPRPLPLLHHSPPSHTSGIPPIMTLPTRHQLTILPWLQRAMLYLNHTNAHFLSLASSMPMAYSCLPCPWSSLACYTPRPHVALWRPCLCACDLHPMALLYVLVTSMPSSGHGPLVPMPHVVMVPPVSCPETHSK